MIPSTLRDFDSQIALTLRRVLISESTQLGGGTVPAALLLCCAARDIRKNLPVANNGLRRRAAAILRAAS